MPLVHILIIHFLKLFIDAGHQGVDVGLFRQEVGLDLQRAVWLRGLQPQIASAPGPRER